MTSSQHSQPAGIAERALSATVYKQFKRRVLDAVRSRLRSAADQSLVMDVYQTVFMKAHQRICADKAVPPDILTLLLDWATNEAHDQVRSRVRRRIGGEPDEDRVPASQPHPEAQVVAARERAEEKRILGLIFDEMRPDAVEALRLVELEELSYEEAAGRLGCSETAFKSRLQKARASYCKARARVLARLHVPGCRKVVVKVKLPLDARYGGIEGAVRLVAAGAGREAVYYFQVSTDQESWDACPEVTRCRTLVTGLTVGTTYYFRVQTRTRKGLSDWSTVVSFVVR